MIDEVYLQRVRRLIERHGQAIQNVVDPANPAGQFAYTVGLTELGLPELWLDVPNALVNAQLLNRAADALVSIYEPHDRIADGCVINGLAQHPVKLRGPVGGHEALVAGALYGPGNVTVMQVLLASPLGLYPGDPGYVAYGWHPTPRLLPPSL